MIQKWFFHLVVLALLGSIGVWLFFIFVVPDPKEIIAERDAKISRLWKAVSAQRTKNAMLDQRQTDFEIEVRRHVNPEAWVADAMVRRDLDDLATQIQHIRRDLGSRPGGAQ